MSNACSLSCGFCGRCTAAWEPRDEDTQPQPCDWCEKLIMPGDAVVAFFGGRFCSDDCATQYETDFRTYAEREGLTETQPDLLSQE